MKRATLVAVMMLVAFSGLAVAQLISSTSVAAEVPFEFVVANRVVPAGRCIVQAATMDGRSLKIGNQSAKITLLSTASLTEGKAESSNYSLVFKHYGDRYFLSAVKMGGSRTIYRLPESKAEVELRAQNVSSTEEILLASAK